MNITSRRVHGGEVLGATPGHPLLVPALSAAPGLSMSRQQALLDLQAIQRIPGLAGYWPADPAYAYQDSAGYTPATVGGVVGQVRDISQATTPVARRNLLTYSEQFDNAAWDKINVTITSNAAIAPDGTLTADKIVADSTQGQHRADKTTTTTAGDYTFSCYVKAGEYGFVQLLIGLNGSKFNVTNGTVVADFSSVGTITSVGVYWYRCSVKVAASANDTVRVNVHSTGEFNDYTGDGTSGLYIWGAQLELGAGATPYQKIVTGTGDVFAPGNHAYQKTTSKKPILKRTPTSNVYWLNSDADDELTATLGNLGAACTVAKAGAEGVTFTEGVTISSTYNIAPAFGFNGDVAIFNRALTASEKALLTRYMQRGVPVLGANLVTNGTFDTGISGWTGNNNANLSYADGKLSIESLSSYGRATEPVTLNTGVGYLILAKVTAISNVNAPNTVNVTVNSDGSSALFSSAGTGSRSMLLVYTSPDSATRYLSLQNNSPSAGIINAFDNVSMKAIL